MTEEDVARLNIAVLLPCYNEGKSIASVVIGFRKALPAARIYVYDNNSSDDTSAQAAFAGATVVPSRRQGKGNVVRQMFADIEADVYVMADGDGTYDPTAAPRMIDTLLADRADMVVGTRRNVTEDAGRNGHAFETEMSVHASTLRLPVSEIEFDYGRRVEGSESKLSTFRDGFRILRMMGMLVKETRPFMFFSSVSAGLFGLAAILSVPVLAEYFDTGLVSRMPTWMLAMTLLLGAMMSFTAGVILDSLSRARVEQKRIHYLSIAPARGEKHFRGSGSVSDRREADQAISAPQIRKTSA